MTWMTTFACQHRYINERLISGVTFTMKTKKKPETPALKRTALLYESSEDEGEEGRWGEGGGGVLVFMNSVYS